jgi:RND superfamily putative drug exporter
MASSRRIGELSIVSLASMSRFVLRHKLLVVLFWVAMTVAGVVSTGPVGDALSTRFDLPGTEATEVNTEIARTYQSGGFGNPYTVVVQLPEGTTADDPAVQEELTAVLDKVENAAPETRSVSYVSTGDPAFVSADGRTTFALIYPLPAFDGPSPSEPAVERALQGATVAGELVHVAGFANAEQASGDEQSAGVLVETLIGAGGALIVLLWTFGSLLAFLPLLVAGVAILSSFLLVWGLTGITEVSFIVQFLIALLGLGIAIDYSLLLVTRWREERSKTDDNEAAVQRAMETAGHAIVFSGTTVAISLIALVAIDVPFLRSIGLGGMLIPVVSVAVAITLLPVILATVGPKVDWPRLRRGDQESRLWHRWSELIVRHRVVATVASLALLIAITIPALSIELSSPGSASFAEETVAGDLMHQAGFAPGVTTPYDVLVKGADPTEVAGGLAKVGGVVTAVAPEGEKWRRGGSALVLVLPESGESAGAGRDTVEAVRDAAHAMPGEVRVGGTIPGDVDFIDATYGNFPLILGAILLVTFALLVRAFRSIVLPLKAVLLNALSVAATYGILVLVWQEGHGTELLFDTEATGAIPSWLPLMIFSFLFGLSMDYEVFILARMREEYDRTGSTREAVVRGMSHTGRLVTTAAIILFLAFVSMSTIPEVDVKIMATGLAAGILLDATLIRGLLVPAAVALMGHINWWIPSWLERFVPAHPHGGEPAAAD